LSPISKYEVIHINHLSPQRNKMPRMPQHPLVAEITVALAIKLIVILAAALFVFSPRQRPKIDAASMREHLIGASPQNQPRSILP
jgi:hypothetical protein